MSWCDATASPGDDRTGGTQCVEAGGWGQEALTRLFAKPWRCRSVRHPWRSGQSALRRRLERAPEASIATVQEDPQLVGAVEIFDGLFHLRIVFEALLEGPHPVAVLLQSLRDEVLPPSTER